MTLAQSFIPAPCCLLTFNASDTVFFRDCRFTEENGFDGKHFYKVQEKGIIYIVYKGCGIFRDVNMGIEGGGNGEEGGRRGVISPRQNFVGKFVWMTGIFIIGKSVIFIGKFVVLSAK